jgi:hypothetical protein
MACPNFKNGPKNGLRPLGVKISHIENLETKKNRTLAQKMNVKFK